MLSNVQPNNQHESANVRVGKNVAKYRQGMSQAKLAEKLAAELGKNVDPTTITRIENGKRAITVDELEAFARIFSVMEEDLLADTDLGARVQKVDDAYRDLLHAQRGFRLAYSRLQQLAEELRCAIFDRQLREDDVVQDLGDDLVEQIREDLEATRKMLNGEDGIPWPIAAEFNEAGSVISYEIANFDGTPAT